MKARRCIWCRRRRRRDGGSEGHQSREFAHFGPSPRLRGEGGRRPDEGRPRGRLFRDWTRPPRQTSIWVDAIGSPSSALRAPSPRKRGEGPNTADACATKVSAHCRVFTRATIRFANRYAVLPAPAGWPSRRFPRDVMNPLPKFIFVCALLIFGGYAACETLYPTLYLRYKLTVNIRDRGELKTGSGVIEVRYDIVPDGFVWMGGGTRVSGSVRGNAVTVDLGRDGLVFVLNVNDTRHWKSGDPIPPNLVELPLVALGLGASVFSSELKRAVLQAQAMPRKPVRVPATEMPLMVRFGSDSVPSTIRPVSAAYLEQDLGESIHFESATLELTDEPLSGIPANWPEWLKKGDPREIIFPCSDRSPVDMSDLRCTQISAFRRD